MSAGRLITVVIALLVTSLLLCLGAVSIASAQFDDQQHVEMVIVVTDDGEIDSMAYAFEFGRESYELFEWIAADEGYDSVAALLANAGAEDPELGDPVDVADTALGNGYLVEFRFESVDATESDEVAVAADDGVVSFRWIDDGDADAEDGSSVIVTVEMPAPVTETNALEVDGNVATWHLHERSPTELYAEAEPGTDDSAGDGTGHADGGTNGIDDGEETVADGDPGDRADGDDAADDGLPAFDPIAALLALVATTLAVARSRR